MRAARPLDAGRGAVLAVTLAGAILLAGGCSSRLRREEIEVYEGFGATGDAAVRFVRAETAASSSRHDEALELATALREEFPRNILVHRLYQDARIALGQSAECVREYERLQQSRPSALHDTLLARLQTDPQRGAALAQAAVEKDDRFAWGWYARGWWESKRERPQEAQAALQRALELQPDLVPALRSYAVLLRQTDTQAAIDAIQQALDEHPERVDHRVFLASLRLSQGGSAVAEAEAGFRAILAERPEHVEAAKGLAAALLERGAWRQAKEIYERLAVQAPSDASVEFNLGVVAEEFEKDLPAAIAHYERFLERATDASVLVRTRARLWIQELQVRLESAETSPPPAVMPP